MDFQSFYFLRQDLTMYPWLASWTSLSLLSAGIVDMGHHAQLILLLLAHVFSFKKHLL
jgi:hypothetical protein